MFFKKKKNEDLTLPEQPTNSPYLSARQEWLERYGDYVKQSKNWRIMAFCSFVIALLSITGNVIQMNQQKVIPYIIEVDNLGRTSVVGRADSMQTAPQELVQSVIANCITDWRTVTADIELQRKMISRLSYYFVGSAQGVMKEWYNVNNPYDIASSGKLIHVDIKTLPLPISENSYRIEWTETIRNHSGMLVSAQNFEANVTIQIKEPKNVDVILHNPGGIYITEISATTVLKK